MHIVIIRHSIRNWGADKVLFGYIRHLLRQGHRVTYYVNALKTDFVIPSGTEIRKIPIPSILGTILFTIFTKFSSDVVLIDLAVMGVFASVRNKKRLMMLAQDYDTTYYQNPLIIMFVHWAYHYALGRLGIPVIAEAEGLAAILGRYQPRDITVIPNSVDIEKFQRNSASPYHSQRGHHSVILLFARPDRRKGLDVAIQALELLKKIRPEKDYELWVIGTERVPVEGIAIKHFGFIDTEEELRDLLSAVDIHLLPSRSEGLSLLQLQALACGCAAVSTAASTILTHDVNGLISPIEDAEALAQNIHRVLSDSTLRSRLQIEGRRLAENFSLQKSCEKFEKFLLAFCQQRSTNS